MRNPSGTRRSSCDDRSYSEGLEHATAKRARSERYSAGETNRPGARGKFDAEDRY